MLCITTFYALPDNINLPPIALNLISGNLFFSNLINTRNISPTKNVNFNYSSFNYLLLCKYSLDAPLLQSKQK